MRSPFPRRRPDPALIRISTGRGALSLPRWLERLFDRLDLQPPRIALSSLSDDRLAAMGLTREEVLAAEDAAPGRPRRWNPPAYWLADHRGMPCVPR